MGEGRAACQKADEKQNKSCFFHGYISLFPQMMGLFYYVHQELSRDCEGVCSRKKVGQHSLRAGNVL